MTIDSEPGAPYRFYRGDTLSASLALAAVLVLLEMIKAHRSSDWIAMTPQEWIGTAIGLALYAVIIMTLTAAIRGAVQPRCHAATTANFSMLTLPASALILWFGLALLGGGVRPSALALVIAIMWVFTTIRWLLAIHLPSHLAMMNVSFFLGAIYSAILMPFTHASYFIHGERSLWVTLNAFDYMVMGTLGCAAVGHTTIRWQRLSRNRRFMYVFGCCWVCLGATTGISSDIFNDLPSTETIETSASTPSLVLITADSLRADASSLDGGPAPTPHLEALAARGSHFERSYSLAPWTLPSMYGMFSSAPPPGLTPGAGKEAWNEEITLYRFEKDSTTLAQSLNSKGYYTGGFTSNALLHDKEGILRGFDTTTVVGHRTHVKTGPFAALPLLQEVMWKLGAPWVVDRPVDTSAIMMRSALNFLDARRGSSFFLWVHFMDPHGPYAPPKKFAPSEGPWPVYCNADPHWGTPLTDEEGRVDLTQAEQDHVRALYHGEVSYVDYCVGQILQALDAQGLRETTYITFTSDHGEEFWDHSEYGHGQSLYEELVRVPLIIAGPGIPAAQIPNPVSSIDLMPTLAEFTGAEASPHWQGTSLASALRQGSAPSGPIFAQGTNLFSQSEPQQMIVDRSLKLIRETGGSHAQLFDLERDPGERENLLAEGGAAPAPLEKSLQAWADQVPAPVSAVYAGDYDDAISEELAEALRAFGYLQ